MRLGPGFGPGACLLKRSSAYHAGVRDKVGGLRTQLLFRHIAVLPKLVTPSGVYLRVRVPDTVIPDADAA